jgi:plastocyanin
MQKLRVVAYGLIALAGVWVIGSAVARAQVKSQDPRIALADNCDPITFNAFFKSPNACVGRGDTTITEFGAVLFSPLIDINTTNGVFVGHPAWRMEPSYVSIHAGQKVKVTNSGGEGHTFTEVTSFGGGSITNPPPGLNGVDVTRAPECPANPANLAVIAPGQTVDVARLSNGPHNFMCCIHPWMRAVVDVE